MLSSAIATYTDTIVLKGYDTSQENYDFLKEGSIHIVGMNLTSECNYRCPYCFVGSENLKTLPDEMTTSQKLNVIEQAKNCGAKVLIICGKGEPFADAAIWKIIEKASSLDMWTIIYTNGSLIKRCHLDSLSKANVSLMVKVDSLDPADYEASIGHKPPQDDIRSWILELRDALPPQHEPFENRILCRFGINAVVSKANERSIPYFSQFCYKEQILFSCRVVQRTGNAIQNWDWLVGDKQNRLNKIAKECSMRTVSSQAPNGSCSIYRYGVTIENNGDIYMCPNSRVFQNRIGNVCDEPLTTLLKRRVSMYPLDSRSGYCFVRARNKQLDTLLSHGSFV
jgi:MoaA/NifB/PqqE/SkfB family radical SAM enzyme